MKRPIAALIAATMLAALVVGSVSAIPPKKTPRPLLVTTACLAGDQMIVRSDWSNEVIADPAAGLTFTWTFKGMGLPTSPTTVTFIGPTADPSFVEASLNKFVGTGFVEWNSWTTIGTSVTGAFTDTAASIKKPRTGWPACPTPPACAYTPGTSGCIVLTDVAITDGSVTYTLSGSLTFTPTCQLGAAGCSYATGDPLYTGSGTFSVTGSQPASGTWVVPASFSDGDTPYQFTDGTVSRTCVSAAIRQVTPNITLTASSGGANIGGFLSIRQDTVGTTSRVSGVFQTGTAPLLPAGTFNNAIDSLGGVTILC